jgi:hypothetical protein
MFSKFVVSAWRALASSMVVGLSCQMGANAEESLIPVSEKNLAIWEAHFTPGLYATESWDLDDKGHAIPETLRKSNVCYKKLGQTAIGNVARSPLLLKASKCERIEYRLTQDLFWGKGWNCRATQGKTVHAWVIAVKLNSAGMEFGVHALNTKGQVDVAEFGYLSKATYLQECPVSD